MARGRPRKKITLEDLPKSFRKGIIQFMADRQIDNLEQGLEIAGIILIGKNKEINKKVNAEADRRVKAKFMTSLNKALATRDKTAYNNGFWEAKRIYCVTYPCKVCGKTLEIKSNSKEVKTIREKLYQDGWAHRDCNN